MDNLTTPSEIWPESTDKPNYGLLIVAFFAVFFYGSSKVALALIPQSATHAEWRWKNICTSLFHAIIIGVWALLCFWEEPKLMEDLIKTYTPFCHTMISVSVGYFVYDVIDMLLYQRTRQSFELIGHHFVILACYLVAVTTRLYVGYAVVGLLVEINSIFLHIRQLMQICGFKKNNQLYRFNSLINLGTFIIFRITLLAWMTRWIVINKDLVPLIFYSLGSIGLAIMTFMNIILFYRLLRSDFIPRKKDCTSKNE